MRTPPDVADRLLTTGSVPVENHVPRKRVDATRSKRLNAAIHSQTNALQTGDQHRPGQRKMERVVMKPRCQSAIVLRCARSRLTPYKNRVLLENKRGGARF